MLAFEEPNFAKQLYGESMTREDRIRRAGHIAKSDIEALAPMVLAPTLLLAASADAWSFGAEDASRQLAALIPDGRLVLFDEASTGLSAPPGKVPPAITAIESFLSTLPLELPTAPAASKGILDAALSARELEVLRLVAAGKSSREIGEELVLSRRTVERHVANIYLKTETHGRAQLATYALRNSLT
jgi:DNA-binding CsgD family transcriptional regulator